MRGLAVVGGEALARALPVAAAADALESALAGEVPQAPARAHVATAAGDLLLMPAHGEAGVGVKLVTVTPGNPARGLPLVHGLYVVFDASSQAPLALLDGGALTALRTAAVSAVATRHLARAEARHLVLFGAGVQAAAHLEAMRAVRPLDRVTVVSRTRERAEALAERARALGLEAAVGTPSDVATADLVCTCTTSATPVLDGSLLPPGVHVNAIGAYTPSTRELDDEAVRRARIVVETREAALAEAGDLLIPLRAGVITEAAIVADLAEVVRGAPVRRGPEDLTVFKSVGVAFEDLVVARAALERLEGEGR